MRIQKTIADKIVVHVGQSGVMMPWTRGQCRKAFIAKRSYATRH